MSKGKLILIPTVISPDTADMVLPKDLLSIINEVDVFITENIKTTRRYLRSIGYTKDFDQIKYYLLNKHTEDKEIPEFLHEAEEGAIVGLFSEAGIPCVADPGAKVVKIAHEKEIVVKPLSGPSSLILALSASGFNGQNFAFNGYLPIQDTARNRKIKELETRIYKEHQTQIFIEAPYRNNKLFKAFLQHCEARTRICIACELTSDQEFIKTLTVAQWKKQTIELHKKNTVFLLYK